MDEIVLQAMAKWPNVPNCYGWLGLDARGRWYMRDAKVQSMGAFASGGEAAKGSLLAHEKLISFIQRNYAVDEHGNWYFQNGPQRVYVELEITPWIWRVDKDWNISAHDGRAANYLQCFSDQQGKAYLLTNLGFGLVHTLDVEIVARALDENVWSLQEMKTESMPLHFGYRLSPALWHKDEKKAG